MKKKLKLDQILRMCVCAALAFALMFGFGVKRAEASQDPNDPSLYEPDLFCVDFNSGDKQTELTKFGVSPSGINSQIYDFAESPGNSTGLCISIAPSTTSTWNLYKFFSADYDNTNVPFKTEELTGSIVYEIKIAKAPGKALPERFRPFFNRKYSQLTMELYNGELRYYTGPSDKVAFEGITVNELEWA